MNSKRSVRVEGQGVCLCTADQQPIVPATPNRTTIEQLVQVRLIAPANQFASVIDSLIAQTAEHEIAPSSLLPRDSQRLFCVWRI
ncbi:hypothetical protein [Bythopirellula polymerisocia]|uniref:hypothetical protein n=1 Tax=Bythopirellula polymerisocia TaxID=2528003 RepID=UPI0011B48011|nr:hypothetical protein [Bythopirellula polymerisocia]